MVTFIIVRHGYSVFNKEKRFTGQIDADLDERGFAQAKKNAEYILANYHIDAIYSSDLCRAYNTVKPVADALGIPNHTSTDLRELDIGRWEGLRIADVKRDEPEALAFYRQRIPEANAGGGETRLQLRQRITRIMNEIAVENDGKTVLIGSHGGAIRALCCAWMGYTIEEIDKTTDLKNASITIVRYDAETKHAEFVLYNYNEHLGDLAT